MKNTPETARHWTQFVANRPGLSAGTELLAQFEEGEITRLCEYGCNSFNLRLGKEPKSYRLFYDTVLPSSSKEISRALLLLCRTADSV